MMMMMVAVVAMVLLVLVLPLLRLLLVVMIFVVVKIMVIRSGVDTETVRRLQYGTRVVGEGFYGECFQQSGRSPRQQRSVKATSEIGQADSADLHGCLEPPASSVFSDLSRD
ncbi:hypothetical protein ElyMa_003680200 [Elysia marginata]|uniref:Secreted protein n=1 Tax=Elysia marginata TaxID=1093978 RepID=A0AAV4EZ51_9GAST|nr:hypothetical protein ElyMa_003680200 [Elysia marginata]